MSNINYFSNKSFQSFETLLRIFCVDSLSSKISCTAEFTILLFLLTFLCSKYRLNFVQLFLHLLHGLFAIKSFSLYFCIEFVVQKVFHFVARTLVSFASSSWFCHLLKIVQISKLHLYALHVMELQNSSMKIILTEFADNLRSDVGFSVC